MKKTYETPSIEVVKFQYRDQVVVASGARQCDPMYALTDTDGDKICDQGTPEYTGHNN